MNPLFNLPFMLSALGAGSRGFTNGMAAATDRNRAEDEHMRLMQQMQMQNENAGFERQMRPLQLQAAQNQGKMAQNQLAEYTSAHSPHPMMIQAWNKGMGPEYALPENLPEDEFNRIAPILQHIFQAKQIAARNKALGIKNSVGYQTSLQSVKDAENEYNRALGAHAVAANLGVNEHNDPKLSSQREIQTSKDVIDAKMKRDRARAYHNATYGDVPTFDATPANPLSGALLDPSEYDTVPETEGN